MFSVNRLPLWFLILHAEKGSSTTVPRTTRDHWSEILGPIPRAYY